MCRRVLPRNRLARACITSTSCRSRCRVVSVASWLNTVNIGAPAPSSMPPLGSMTQSRTCPVFTEGAMPVTNDHNTEPLPAPVAPATRM
ncbi:Uncharacterised protein [Mycobacteroides abscessus subsp. abscessus]|nr:Uncharacterised protein [Mycobacteroides abscessus subsp. abscessus]